MRIHLRMGYYKTVRGVNYHGIESGAAFAIAEMNRFAARCPTLSWSRWTECNATRPCEKGVQSRSREPISLSKADPKCVGMIGDVHITGIFVTPWVENPPSIFPRQQKNTMVPSIFIFLPLMAPMAFLRHPKTPFQL